MKNSNQSLTSKAIQAMAVLTMLIIVPGVSTFTLGVYTAHADGEISDMGGDAGAGINNIDQSGIGINDLGGDAGAGINDLGGDAGVGINDLGGDAGAGINDMGGDAGQSINDMGGDAGQPQEVTISSSVIVPTPPIIVPPILTPPTTPSCTSNCNNTPGCTQNCNPCTSNCNPCTQNCNPCTSNCNPCTQNCNACTQNCSTPGCTSDCGGGWSPPPIYLAAVPITWPPPFIYLNQVPYTGLGDNLLAAIYLLALALLSAGAAYLVAYRDRVETFMEKRRAVKTTPIVAPVKVQAAPIARTVIESPYQSRYVFSSATMSWTLA